VPGLLVLLGTWRAKRKRAQMLAAGGSN